MHLFASSAHGRRAKHRSIFYRRPALFPRIAESEASNMLLMVAGVILVLWILGLVALPAAGALIHVLLIVALVVVIAHFLGLGRSSAGA